MDKATIAGITIGFLMVVISVLKAEGVEGLVAFWDVKAFLIVVGGTTAALLVHFPMNRVVGLFKVLKKVMTAKEEDTARVIATLVDFSQRARTEGFLALEEEVANLDNDFLKRGTQLVIDGADSDFIRNMLETELGFIRERHKVGMEIFNALGTYAPALGIIGTILGMILMLRTLTEPAKVAGAMAIALVCAFYGLSAGYILFLPMAGKLRRRSDEEILIKEIILRGVLLLQSQASPTVMENNLKAYLEPAKRTELEARRAAEEGTPPEEGA